MENAVIGVFDDYQHARDAADALVAAGFREWAVQVSPQEESYAARETAMDDHARYASSEGWSIGNFFRTLFGLDADHEHAHSYAEALRRGSFLVTVEAEGEAPIEQAREIMGQFHPIDMDERAAHWRTQGWSRHEAGSKAFTDDQVQGERSAYQTMSGGGQRGNANVRSFAPVGEGAAPGGGSEIGGMTGLTSMPPQVTPPQVTPTQVTPTQDMPAQHSYQATADAGGGAGFGSVVGGDTRLGSAAVGAASMASAAASRPSGSGGTLGSLGAGNADLHESAGMTGDATDRLREEVMGGESLGRDTMGGNQPGSVRDAMGAGSASGDPSSLPAASLGTGATASGSLSDTARQSEGMYDQGLGRQTAASRQEHEPTTGIMGNAAMRDSTAPDIYTVDHDADYRSHWQKAYGMEGRYEDIEPAYRFGADLRRNDSLKRYHDWNEIEPEARRTWEADSAGSNWEQAKGAVRHAWERMKE